MMARLAFINSLVGKPYRRGAAGPDEFDCYGLARHVQKHVFGRDLPLFEAPEESGRISLAAFLATHPERKFWVNIGKPVDGALVSMAKQEIGYHIGVYLADDGGVIIHALEGSGVIVDQPFSLQALGWRRLQYLVRQ